jgi:hypothetical protein
MFSARPRQMSTPVVTKAITGLQSDQTTIQYQEVIKGDSNSPYVQMVIGHRDSIMGHSSKSGRQNLCYRPTPALIALFGKTRVRCRNPNLAKQLPRGNRSYADIVRGGMDPSAVPVNTNRQGMC